jgi:hypothetical protein
LPSAVDITPSLNCIKQDINLKTFFAGWGDDEDYSVLRAKSIWQPPLPLQKMGLWVTSFIKNLQGLLSQRRSAKNLTPWQRCLLADLHENKSFLIASANKNLGPFGIETEQYIQLGLEHLLDTSTYKLLTKHNAHQDALPLKTKIYDWTLHHWEALTDEETNFIRHHLAQAKRDPHGYFYLLIKLHKEKISGRPVCLDCGSLSHALWRWVDAQLQPVVKDEALYLKNSAKLKGDLDEMTLPANASLFTYDAVAIYPSINTAQCLDRQSGFFLSPDISQQYRINTKALLEAIEWIMYSNHMHFSNVLVKQISGIAMGMSPAPTLANLFVAVSFRCGAHFNA